MRKETIDNRFIHRPRRWTNMLCEAERPTLMPGSFVWAGQAGYVAELVERHGTEWVAGVVATGDAPRHVARLRFIPVGELHWV